MIDVNDEWNITIKRIGGSYKASGDRFITVSKKRKKDNIEVMGRDIQKFVTMSYNSIDDCIKEIYEHVKLLESAE